MNTKSIIEIFRGDDSDALGYQTIVGTIHTDLDLAGCKAVFRYLGFFQEFDPIPEDGKLTIVIPAASSIQFPPGLGYASLKIYDIDRKVRTFTNRIPVFVSTKTPCRCGGEFDVEFSPFPELEPLKIFIGPNADDYDLYTGFVMKIIDRASAEKYGLSMIYDDMDSDMGANSGVAASPAAVKAAYDAILGMLADNYYNKEQTDEQIDKLAAYYITSDVQGHPFATHAALVNATTYYSGGSVRVPTRNDYAIVITDEMHNNEEWRYIYSKNAQGVGQWEPQYAVEGVIVFDDYVTKTSGNGVKSSGIWSAIWGALSALPTGFTSLYDWCVSQLAPKVARTELFPAWAANTAYTTYSLVIHENAVYKCTTAHTSGAEWDSTKWTVATGADVLGVLLNYLALSNKPQINNVTLTGASQQSGDSLGLVDKTGDQTIGGNKTFTGYGIFYDFTVSHPQGQGYVRIYALANERRVHIEFYDAVSGSQGELFLPVLGGYGAMTLAAIENLAPDAFLMLYDGATVDLNTLYCYQGRLYRCILGYTFQSGDSYPPDDTTHWALATVEDVLAALRTAIAGKADVSAIPYTLGTPIVIDDSSVQTDNTDPNNPIAYGAATLDNRTANIVQVTAATALDELRITFPAATSGKVRDFGLRVEIGTGSAALAAPALVPIAPTGETIKIENADGTIPELADGTATAKGVTLLYFSETAPGVFVVKGEQVEEVA